MARSLTLLLAATALSAACMGTDATAVSNGPFYALSVSVPDSTRFPAGTAVSVRTTVTHDDAPVLAAPIGWTVKEGGGSVNLAAAVTDTLGQATILWTLGDTAGINTLIIATADRADTLSVIAVIGDPAYVLAVGNDSKSAAVGENVVLQARVTDKAGNNVPGATIGWSTSNASLSAPSGATDANGIAQVTFNASTPGTYFVTATLANRATHIFQIVVQ
jgi:hypothetical protein